MSRSSRGSLTTPAIFVVLPVVVVGSLAGCTRPENVTSDATVTLPTTEISTASTTEPPATTTTPTDSTEPTSTTTEPTGASTVPPTSAPTGTTTPADTPATTTPATPTTAPEPLDDLTLFYDGVAPFRFGDRDIDVVPALTDALGEPVSDELTEYPTADAGMFLDVDGETSFVARFGRTVCFADALCVQFGAGAPETLIFSGWRIDDRAPSELRTEDGIVIGSTLAEHADVITFDPELSCYQVAYGAAAGIDVTLLSDDGVFAAPNADGDGLVLGDPDPTLVTVQAMSAGELPVPLFADC
jgi:hypothetical protein